MSKKALGLYQFKDLLNGMSDLDAMRVAFCYQIGSTFTVMSLMEDDVVTYILSCDTAYRSDGVETDISAGENFLNKLKLLKAQTLGNLINILSKGGVHGDDLSYLRWLKKNRDYFVHRFFENHEFPGDMNDSDLVSRYRRLCYLEIIFSRASQRMPRILHNAGLMEVIKAEGGILAINVGAVSD